MCSKWNWRHKFTVFFLNSNKNKWIKNNNKTYLIVEKVIQIKSAINNCVDLSAKTQWNIVCEKIVWNPSACAWEINRYLIGILISCITDDLEISFDDSEKED